MSDYQTNDPVERAILDFMADHPTVTTREIAAHCAAGEVARTRAFRNLRRAGVVKYAGRRNKEWLWTVLDADDRQELVAARRRGPEAAMWTAMRTLNVFSPADIAMALSSTGVAVSDRDIQSYCSALAQARYLAVLHRARSGGRKGQRSARYRLAKNTGPLPPLRKRKTVLVDQNEDRIVFAGGDLL